MWCRVMIMVPCSIMINNMHVMHAANFKTLTSDHADTMYAIKEKSTL